MKYHVGAKSHTCLLQNCFTCFWSTGHRTVSLLRCSYDPMKIMNRFHRRNGLSCHKPVFKHTHTLNRKHSHILPWLVASPFRQRRGRIVSHLITYQRSSVQLQFLLQTSHVTLGNSFTLPEFQFSVRLNAISHTDTWRLQSLKCCVYYEYKHETGNG